MAHDQRQSHRGEGLQSDSSGPIASPIVLDHVSLTLCILSRDEDDVVGVRALIVLHLLVVAQRLAPFLQLGLALVHAADC